MPMGRTAALHKKDNEAGDVHFARCYLFLNGLNMTLRCRSHFIKMCLGLLGKGASVPSQGVVVGDIFEVAPIV